MIDVIIAEKTDFGLQPVGKAEVDKAIQEEVSSFSKLIEKLGSGGGLTLMERSVLIAYLMHKLSYIREERRSE